MTNGKEENRSLLSVIAEFVIIFVVAYILAYGLQNYFFGNFQIEQHSMEPTLYEGDRVLINRIGYRFSTPQRSDIVILIDPMGSSNDFVKRVIGLPGDKLEIRRGTTYIDGKELDEPYLAADRSSENIGPITIHPDEYFVMGDNRTVSSDSRRFGPVKRTNILGKVIVVWWPPNHARVP